MTSEELIERLRSEAQMFSADKGWPYDTPEIHEAMMTGALIVLEMSREDDHELLRRLNAGLSRKD